MKTPLSIALSPNSLRMDQPRQVSPDAKSLRCMIRTDTAASSGEAELAEVDASSASLMGSELRAVGRTSADSCAQTTRLGSFNVLAFREALLTVCMTTAWKEC